MRRKLSAWTVVLSIGLTANPTTFAADSWPAAPVSSAGDVGRALGDFEPSDAAVCPARKSLFIVDDEGKLAEIDLAGVVKRVQRVGGDLEGVTLAADNNPNVYVGRERDATIIEVHPDNGPTGRTWRLSQMDPGKKNHRLESLTFIPDGNCSCVRGSDGKPYNGGRGSSFEAGGLFLAGHQGDGRIYIYDLDLKKSDAVTFVGRVGPFRDDDAPLIDLSGLCFHRPTGTLYALWDEENRIAEIDASKPDFALARIWTLPTESIDQEGLALIDDGCDTKQSRIVIAEDDKRRHRVWLADRFPLGDCRKPTKTPASKSD